MYLKRRLLPKVLLFAGFLVLFLLLKYQDAVRDSWSRGLGVLKIYFDNFFLQSESAPKRRPPISLVGKETELKLYIGEPFRSFSRRDWDKFWGLIYGVFPEERPQNEGMPARKRQLSSDEIAFRLMELYPKPFAFFNESHWQIFFGIVLQNK